MSFLGLTLVGCFWSLLSLVSAAVVCTAYYLPYWLSGYINEDVNDERETYAAHFGSFRRCTYLSAGKAIQGCGRYTNFSDIPSIWWQVCTITVGLGCSLSIVVAIISLPAWWAKGLITQNIGRILGLFQVLSAILISTGCILYPIGWSNSYVIEVCGRHAAAYMLGNCTIGWAYYLMLGGACLLFICASLSTVAGRPAH